MRESYQFSDERISTLRFPAKPLKVPMIWIYEEYGKNWKADKMCEDYGILKKQEQDIRDHIKKHFKDLKEKQIKDVLDVKTWITQKTILLKAKQLQKIIGPEQCDDMNGYEDVLKKSGIKLEPKEKKQITTAVSWKNPDAQKVIKKIHTGKANPLYGLFDVDGEIVEYKADGDLRDNENVALDPQKTVNDINEAYFKKEVLPHVSDAWIDADKKDDKDQEIGIVGYEIPFNRHF